MIPLSEVRNALESVGLVSGLGVTEIHARLAMGMRLADTGYRVLAFYLTEMEEGRLYQDTGHSNTAQYAEMRLGLDRRRTAELIAVGRKLLTLPATDHAFCRQDIGWSKVILLASVASPEHEEEWLERAKKLTCRELALEVRQSKPGSRPRAPGDRKGLPEIRFKIAADVGVLTHRKLELAKQKLSDEHARPLNDAECLDMMAELVLELEEDGTVPGRTRVPSSLYRIVLRSEGADDDSSLFVDTDLGPVPLEEDGCVLCDAETVHGDDGTDHRAPPTPPALRRRVLTRDGSRCRSCGSRHRLMAHHIRFRSNLGPTCASNLLVLCVRCHGLVHDGLLVLEGESEETIRFLDSQGTPVSDAGAVAALPMLTPPPTQPPAPEPTTLANVPETVDGDWWRRHAHLLRLGKEGIEFQEGTPLAEDARPNVEPTRIPFAEAFSGIVGQDELLQRLETTAKGGEVLGKTFPHTLLTGPAGTGKTTLAHGLSAWLGRSFVKTTGPLLQNVLLLVRVLTSLREGAVLFVEEVHAAARPVLEALYEAMAERCLSLTVHAGSLARTVRFELPAFTLVAATTEQGELPAPLVSRFGLREALGQYAPEDLAQLAARAAASEGVTLDDPAARLLADVARGTPREALRLVDLIVRDVASQGVTVVGGPEVDAALGRLGYDADGLAPLEQRYLSLLRESPTPISLDRLSRLLGTSTATLRDTESDLFRRDLVRTTSRGRVAVLRARPHAVRVAPNVRQPGLPPRMSRRTFGGSPGSECQRTPQTS